MQELIRQINDFAEQADIIEPDAARRSELLTAVNGYIERFLEALPDRPAFIYTEDMGVGLYDSPITEGGMEIEEILRIYKENVDDQALSPVSGKFFGYIPPIRQINDFAEQADIIEPDAARRSELLTAVNGYIERWKPSRTDRHLSIPRIWASV